jgi:hypothetical protein
MFELQCSTSSSSSHSQVYNCRPRTLVLVHVHACLSHLATHHTGMSNYCVAGKADCVRCSNLLSFSYTSIPSPPSWPFASTSCNRHNS